MPGTVETHHGTTIALNGRGALIRGPSGSGKSDLALRCLAVPMGFAGRGAALLVADDQTSARVSDGVVLVSAPITLSGLIEVRGIGIISRAAAGEVPLALVVDLVDEKDVARLPDNFVPAIIAGISVRRIELFAFEGAAPLKLLLALAGHGNQDDG